MVAIDCRSREKNQAFFLLILSVDLSPVDYKGQAEDEGQNTERERAVLRNWRHSGQL